MQSNKQDDEDFDPSAEALIDEFDDERTLEEEEALNGNMGPAVQEELDDLKKESEMPIEELLAYYERMRNEMGDQANSGDEEEEDEEEEEEEEDDGDEEEQRGGRTTTTTATAAAGDRDINIGEESKKQQQQPDQQSKNGVGSKKTVESPQESGTRQQTSNVETANESSSMPSNLPRPTMSDFLIDHESTGIFRSLLGRDFDESDDMDEDYSYSDDENDDERDWRRVIHVGPEYQADVPAGLCEYDDLPPYENEDKLVWHCKPDLTQEEILNYLKQASSLSKKNEISVSPASVPKISNDNMRLYREKMQDITSNTGPHIIEHNHENIIIEHPPENITDVYMRQSRKRMRIEYEIEQENAMDGLNSTCSSVTQSQMSNPREDKSDSISQDTKPELSTDGYFQDEEQLLYLLLQCNHNFDEALRRRKLDPSKYYLHEPMSLWSQDECLGFEHGLKTYGKNFRLIREFKVQTRTHAELVAFYYLWKKSERHDVYTNQYKLDRKRCLSHPGTTDYMDRFIEDNESILNASTSSPALTPTGSNSETNVNIDTGIDNNSQDQLCHSSETIPPTIHYINLPQVSNIQRHHLQLHQQQKDDS